MLNFFRKSKSQDQINKHTSDVVDHLYNRLDMRFREVEAQIKEIELGLQQLETKLLVKDINDKQNYGQLHYKLHEVKNKKIEDDVKDLQTELRKKLIKETDH
jgi:hypothetical protein